MGDFIFLVNYKEIFKYDYHIHITMEFEVTKIGERGQVVIPQSFREHMRIHKGDKFMILQQGDTIILKKLRVPTKDDFERMLKKAHTHAQKHGLTEKDLNEAQKQTRK